MRQNGICISCHCNCLGGYRHKLSEADGGLYKADPVADLRGAYIVCHYTFAKSLNRINLNIGYATWCGVGLIVTSLVSIFAYKEKLSTVGIIGLVLITAGCVMVNAFGNK